MALSFYGGGNGGSERLRKLGDIPRELMKAMRPKAGAQLGGESRCTGRERCYKSAEKYLP